jgi:Na+/H+ antiporter NhaC
VLFFVTSIVAMVAYFWLLFLSPEDATFLEKSLREWAIIIPILIIVYAVLIVIAWIGWALASTAPPLPITGEQTEN